MTVTEDIKIRSSTIGTQDISVTAKVDRNGNFQDLQTFARARVAPSGNDNTIALQTLTAHRANGQDYVIGRFLLTKTISSLGIQALKY